MVCLSAGERIRARGIGVGSSRHIRPYDKNPRQNDQAVEAVARSIWEYGFRVPLVVDADGVIICGHTRWKAAQRLGLEKLPVHVATDLTPEQLKAYRIADNKTAELAEWNWELLPIELGELAGMNYDLGLLGFSDEELAKLLDPGVKEGLTDPDEVPEPPDEATTKPGDLWILGEHRLLCGDAGKAEDADRLLDGNPVHLVNTDPPYNVRVEPRSNNAIAAGLSLDPSAEEVHGGRKRRGHHQAMDVARHPEKAKATHRKMRADHPSGGAHRPLPSPEPSPTGRGQGEGSRQRGVQPAVARLVRPDGPGAEARPRVLHLGWVCNGVDMRTARTTRPCSRPSACTSPRPSSGTKSTRF